MLRIIYLLLWLLLLFPPLSETGIVRAEQQKTIVVTTSMLEHAVREIIPESAAIETIRLIPPASCPGHFDLSPRIVPVLRNAAVVVRHDYQAALEKKISRLGAGDIKTIALSTPGSLLIPGNYQHFAGEVASVFMLEFPGYRDEFLNAVESIRKKTELMTEDIQKRSETWNGQTVITAVMQKNFCEWLGFSIAGVIKRPENTSPRDLEKLLATNPSLIIANLQEGAQAAISLGEKLHVPVAILSNFPDVEGYGQGYSELIEANMERIEKAWQRR